MRNTLAIACVVGLLITGCSNPHDHKVSADPEAWGSDDKLKESIQSLDAEEQELLKGWMLRAAFRNKFGTGDTTDRTIQEAIEEQKAFAAAQAAQAAEQERLAAEQERLAAEVRKQREAAIRKMNETMTVALTELTFQESDFRKRLSDGFVLRFALKNKSDQDLSGVKGTVQFSDIFGDPIKAVDISVDSAIAAGETIEWSGLLRYNQFRDEDKKLRATSPDKLKVAWVPEVFLFADGSVAQVPKQALAGSF